MLSTGEKVYSFPTSVAPPLLNTWAFFRPIRSHSVIVLPDCFMNGSPQWGTTEAVLNQSSYVDSCIMFGRGRVQNGVLVQLKTDYSFEPHDKDAVEKYRALIWPSIQTMNEVAPSHSRLFKEASLERLDCLYREAHRS